MQRLHPSLRFLTIAALLPLFTIGRSDAPRAFRGGGTETSAIAILLQTAGPAAARGGPATAALRAEIDRLITNTGWRGAEWGVLVVSLDRGDTIYSHQADVPLAPASNMKLFTTAAGLYYLGAEFRYSTYLLAAGPVRDSVVMGDLVLYGTGDPTISDRLLQGKLQVWEEFADTLVARGVREVRGDIVGDGSYFSGRGVGAGWREQYATASYAAPAGALSVAENMVTLRITPSSAGARPNVTLVPGGDGIDIRNEATTTAGGGTSLKVEKSGYEGPIVISGRMARGSGALWRSSPVSDPALYSAATFREVLENRGVRVTGSIRSVTDQASSPVTGRSVFAPAFDKTPALRVMAVHRSPPLREILHVINHKSHNFYAEQVLRTVGRVALADGSAEGGARAVLHMMEPKRQPSGRQALVMHDGSGLSPLNRSDARTLIRVLDVMAASPMANEYVTTLPEAGAAGGLRRMGATPASGNLRAKTGTIDRVSALSGYVTASNGERLAFAIVSNNVPSTYRAKRIEDAIGARLAGLSRGGAGGAETGSAASPAEAGSARGPSARAEQTRPAVPAGNRRDAAPNTPAAPPATTAPAKPLPAPAARTHTIRSGDTLDGIAKRYGTTVKALQAANPGLNPRRLIPGKKVRLPQD